MSGACHPKGPDPSDAPFGSAAAPAAPLIALAGAPNVGKSTLFNLLTGARHSVGNYPGTTVEVGRGRWQLDRSRLQEARVLDLPGTYSLDPVSPDEALTHALLVEAPPDDRPDLVVVAVDASRLARSLYLVSQLREHSYRLVVALTMTDVAQRRGAHVATDALSRAMCVPVVAVDPRGRAGAHALADAVVRALAAPPPPPRHLETRSADRADLDVADERFTWVHEVVASCVTRTEQRGRSWSDRIDRWATSPVSGPALFLVAMLAVFEVTTTAAAPLQQALDSFATGPLSRFVSALFETGGLGGSWLHRLVVDGLLAGVGMVVSFVPLMALMFLLLTILEDSGYLARAAVVTDRLMRAIGLPGRAFLPLVVGFGCNVPAISATRVLGNARQRLLTALLVPFTSCTARLTVYVLVASTFFPEHAGLVVFAMYLTSLLLVVLVGLALRATLWRATGTEPLVLDLPPYQRPLLRMLAQDTWVRLKGFLRTASGIIVVAVTAVWLMQSVPVDGQAGFGEVAPRESLYAATARAVAPVFEPAGFGEWETSSALVVGFVAKEAVVSSWAQTYASAEPGDLVDDAVDTGSSGPDRLTAGLRADFDRSSGGHALPAALAFMVFLLAYTPCVATLAAQRREIGLRWTLFGVAVQLAVAWTAAVLVFQVGRLVA